MHNSKKFTHTFVMGSAAPLLLPESLVVAAKAGDITAFETFLASAPLAADVIFNGVDCAASAGGSARTALHLASSAGRAALVSWLLATARRCSADGPSPVGAAAGDISAAVDGPDAVGAPALLLAAVAGHLPCVKLLAAAGASLDAADRSGYTALMYTALRGRSAVFRWLLEAGASATVKHARGGTVKDLLEQRAAKAAADKGESNGGGDESAAAAGEARASAAAATLLALLPAAAAPPAAPGAPLLVDATKAGVLVLIPAPAAPSVPPGGEEAPGSGWLVTGGSAPAGAPSAASIEVQFAPLPLAMFWSSAAGPARAGHVDILADDYLAAAGGAGGGAGRGGADGAIAACSLGEPMADLAYAAVKSAAIAAAEAAAAASGGGVAAALAAAPSIVGAAIIGDVRARLPAGVLVWLSGLQPGTRYVAQARARNRNGWGPWSPRSAELATRPASDRHAVDAPFTAAAETHAAPAPAPALPGVRLDWRAAVLDSLLERARPDIAAVLTRRARHEGVDIASPLAAAGEGSPASAPLTSQLSAKSTQSPTPTPAPALAPAPAPAHSSAERALDDDETRRRALDAAAALGMHELAVFLLDGGAGTRGAFSDALLRVAVLGEVVPAGVDDESSATAAAFRDADGGATAAVRAVLLAEAKASEGMAADALLVLGAAKAAAASAASAVESRREALAAVSSAATSPAKAVSLARALTAAGRATGPATASAPAAVAAAVSRLRTSMRNAAHAYATAACPEGVASTSLRPFGVSLRRLTSLLCAVAFLNESVPARALLGAEDAAAGALVALLCAATAVALVDGEDAPLPLALHPVLAAALGGAADSLRLLGAVVSAAGGPAEPLAAAEACCVEASLDVAAAAMEARAIH